MKELIVKATVIDEICIAKRQEAGNEYETLDYIPGRILWGAFASLYGIRPGDTPPDDFITLFYSGDVIFSNLYPSDVNKIARSNPIPISAVTDKHAPGFAEDEKDYTPAGICDCLIYGVPDKVKQNPEWYVKYKGYYADRYTTSPQYYKTVSQKINYVGRHERDISRGVSKENMLFTRQNIPRGDVFLGFIRSNTDEGDKALDELIKTNRLMTGIEVSVGRSPGRIKVEIYNNDAPLYVFDQDLEVLDFNEIYFTITCLSPTILLDSFLRPFKYIPEEFLKKELTPVVKSCEIINHFSATELIQGWNGAYRRPVETEVAITAGSAFYYKYTLAEGKTKDELVRELNNLRRKGIGHRRPEGFGEIRINDPFHTDLVMMSGEGKNG